MISGDSPFSGLQGKILFQTSFGYKITIFSLFAFFTFSSSCFSLEIQISLWIKTDILCEGPTLLQGDLILTHDICIQFINKLTCRDTQN